MNDDDEDVLMLCCFQLWADETDLWTCQLIEEILIKETALFIVKNIQNAKFRATKQMEHYVLSIYFNLFIMMLYIFGMGYKDYKYVQGHNVAIVKKGISQDPLLLNEVGRGRGSLFHTLDLNEFEEWMEKRMVAEFIFTWENAKKKKCFIHGTYSLTWCPNIYIYIYLAVYH